MKRKVSREEISQKYDLKDLLGYVPSARQKELFATILINKMVNRTAGGEDINREDFAEYSPEYAQKKGVTTSSVDMILNGDMLKSIHDDSSKNIVEIKIADDQVDKAYGHISGMKGHPTIKNGKIRDFFGFNDKKDIIDAVLATDQAKGEALSPAKRKASTSEGLTVRDVRRAIFEEISIDFFGGDDG